VQIDLMLENTQTHSFGRIFDNQHLLDATEIFRKLNVHKKVLSTTHTHTLSLSLSLSAGKVDKLMNADRNRSSNSDSI
jgi:hypothetical protein